MASQAHSFLLPLVKSGEFSDFSLLCKEHEFKLHHVIVCPQSPVFTAALCGGFQETTSKVITVNGFDVSIVRYMVTFLYTGDYELGSETGAKAIQPVEQDQESQYQHDENDEGRHGLIIDLQKMPEDSPEPQDIEDKTTEKLLAKLRVNAIADYYNINTLANLSTLKIKAILQKGFNLESLPLIIQEMSISNRDVDLCTVIAEATAKYIEELTSAEALQNVEFEHTLAIKVLSACGDRIQKLEDKLLFAEMLNSQRKAKERAECEKKNRHNEGTGKVIELLKDTYQCRNCCNKLGCHFERSSAPSAAHYPYVRRCRGCGYGHI